MSGNGSQILDLSNDIMKVQPPLNPNLRKDLEALLEAEMMLNKVREEIKKLAAGLKHMKNVAFGVIEIMDLFTQDEGRQMQGLAAVDNLDSTLRGMFSGAQADFVGSHSGAVGNPKMAKQLVEEMKEMQDFINYEKEQGKLGKKTAVSPAALKNLQDVVTQVVTQFGSAWGNPTAMAALVHKWSSESGTGKYSVELKREQDAFTQGDETTSGLSTATNTKIDYVSKQYQEGMGIMKSEIDSYQKENGNTIRNSHS